MAIWYFAAILCLIASGWFFTVLASVLTKRAKLILIGGTVVLAPLLILLDHVTGGVILMLQKFGSCFRCLEQFGRSISFRRDVLCYPCAAFLYRVIIRRKRAEIASFPSYGLNKRSCRTEKSVAGAFSYNQAYTNSVQDNFFRPVVDTVHPAHPLHLVGSFLGLL